MINDIAICLHDYEKSFIKKSTYGDIYFILLLSRTVPPMCIKKLIMDIVLIKKTLKKPVKLQETC
jgi:hypothetical protein